LPTYAVLLVADGDPTVTDALVVDLSPTECLSPFGVAPHTPRIDYAVKGDRPRPCSVQAGPASLAWQIVDGTIVEADPIGVSVIPAG
jgi:hypothetical protein